MACNCVIAESQATRRSPIERYSTRSAVSGSTRVARRAGT
jgi:hypothetical protein